MLLKQLGDIPILLERTIDVNSWALAPFQHQRIHLNEDAVRGKERARREQQQCGGTSLRHSCCQHGFFGKHPPTIVEPRMHLIPMRDFAQTRTQTAQTRLWQFRRQVMILLTSVGGRWMMIVSLSFAAVVLLGG